MTLHARRLPDDPEPEDPMPTPLPDEQQTVPEGPGERGYSAAVRATWTDPDIRARRIASTKAALARPEVHERVLEAAKRRSAEPCYRKMLSDRQRARMADRAAREAVSESMRKVWARRKAEGWKRKPRPGDKPKIVPAKVFRTEPKFAAAKPEKAERVVAKERATAKVRGTIRPPAPPPVPPRSVPAAERVQTERDNLDAAHAEFGRLLRKAHPDGYPSLLLRRASAGDAVPPRSMWA